MKTTTTPQTPNSGLRDPNSTKVLRIITRLNIGGASIHVVNLCYGMADEYDSILVVGQYEPHESDMAYYAEKHNVSFIKIPQMSREINLVRDLVAFWKLYKLMKAEKPDIVDTHTSKAGTLGRLAAYLAGVPVRIHTFHGNIFKDFFGKFKSAIFVRIERMLAKITTEIIAISERQKQELLDYKICPPEKITIIKLGFDFAPILTDESDEGRFREKYHIPPDALLVAMICRVTAIKNHKLYLEIAEYYKDQNIYWAIIGDGDLRDEIQSQIDKRNLHKVFITGFIKDIKSVFADIDIIVHTSLNEGTPIALMEAMANGKIVISTDVGGIPDFITDGVTGFIMPEPKAQYFIDKLNEFIDGKIDRETFAQNAKKTTQETFRIDRLITETKALYTKKIKKT